MTRPAAATQIDEIAAAWMVRREDGLSVLEEAEFQDWLAVDLAHRDAYERMRQLWDGLGALASQADHSVRPTTAAARPKRARMRWSWNAAWRGVGSVVPQLAAAMLAFALIGAGWWGWETWRGAPTFSQDYATLRGQQKMVRLPDGSTVWLDTDTQARVVFHRDRREVSLPEGQALFAVRHDARDTPFDVLAGPLRVSVLGTRFSVRFTRTGLHGNEVRVAVEEGRVRIASGDAGSNGVQYLVAGQALAARPDGTLGEVVQTDVVVAPWREGRVTFDRATLAEALAELDRYRTGHLRIADPRVALMRVSGSFDLHRLDAFERVLPQVLPVVLRRNGVYIDIVASGS